MSNLIDRTRASRGRSRDQKLMRSYSGRRNSKLPKGYYDYVALNEMPQWLRLIPGEYETEIYIPEEDSTTKLVLPFYHWRRHYDQSLRRFFPCSAGPEPDFDPKPCIGCSKVGPPQDVFSYTVIVLDWFHMVPWEKNGEIQVSKKTGKPVLIARQCDGGACPMCRSDEEKIFGMRKHLTLNYTQKNFLDACEDDTLAKHCLCGEALYLLSLSCPKCGNKLVDVESTDLSKTEIFKARKEGLMCKTCKRTMQPVDEYGCDCGDPRPVTIYDTDVSLANIKTGDRKYTMKVDFARPGPLDEKYSGDLDPYNFEEVFAPPSIEVQKMLYKYNGPVTNVSESDYTENYD